MTIEVLFGRDAGIERWERREVGGVAFEKAVRRKPLAAADAGLMQIERRERGKWKFARVTKVR
jgi:hypothetical protein